MKHQILYPLLFSVILSYLTHPVYADISSPQRHTAVMTAERQESKTPLAVYNRLKEGNQRFLTNQMKKRDLLSQEISTSTSQHPVAIILNCMDSRVPPEIIFDQGIGDIFAIRIAGNIQNNDILGSMEFGAQLAGARLIVVMGHTNCGAIQGACSNVKLGHLTGLLSKIQPAISQANKETKLHDCNNISYVDEIAKDNVLLVMKQIERNSPVISKLIKDKRIGIVGGIQDIATGKVTFFEEERIMPN